MPMTPQPRPLKVASYRQKFFDFVVSALQLLLLVPAGLIFGINGKPRFLQWVWVVQATLLIRSFFPVIFAGFAARALASIALYTITKGTTLGMLEMKEILSRDLNSTDLDRQPIAWLTTNERIAHDEETRNRKEDISETSCKLSTTYVEVKIGCELGTCEVRSIRRSRRPHFSSNLTDRDFDQQIDGFFHHHTLNLQPARPFEHPTGIELHLMGYATNGARPIGSSSRSESLGLNLVMADVNILDLSQRLSQAYNGFYDASRTPYAFTGVDKKVFEEHSSFDEVEYLSTYASQLEKYKNYIPGWQKDLNLPFRPAVVEGPLMFPTPFTS
ncbi:hypothetical protein EX30DRAFT_398385 [Ascodesmis nigricans]|uniref:Uncharacterized protein n=1 Tax=Ascodesmis nigricans TaxID=341454 RepID=A0A4S2ML21_9PEZI|nr:hypothetical protein EX30DRAFT_398385 [Ascodesmis nigricans]